MRISDWSSDVCSSDRLALGEGAVGRPRQRARRRPRPRRGHQSQARPRDHAVASFRFPMPDARLRPMRQIVLDTETTGLEWKKGNRVVEIGCVELVERRPTGRTYHQYIHPEREFEPGAQEVTGLTLEFLADKPKFAAIAAEFPPFTKSEDR